MHNRAVDARTIRHRFYTAAQLRELDRLAIEAGIPGFDLMQRAASALFRQLLEHWPATRELLVLAGGGNNGGDGYVLAGLAAEHRIRARVFHLAEPDTLKGEAAEALEFARARDVEIKAFDASGFSSALSQSPTGHALIVDAMLGTGVSGSLRAPYDEAVNLVNAAGLPVLSVDVPSGLISDTGGIAGDAVCADLTVTFIGMKQGLYTGLGPDYSGQIQFETLGVDLSVYASEQVDPPASSVLDIQSVLPLLPVRKPSTHKGQCGNVLIVGGDRGFGGAVLMAAEAAARAGAGTVSLLTREEHVAPMLARRPEVMVRATDARVAEDPEAAKAALEPLLDKASVLLLGPGMGQGPWSRLLLAAALMAHEERGLPLVLDADALVLLARAGTVSGGPPVADSRLQQENCIITPHPGEAARLLGLDAEAVQGDRFAAVLQLQQRWSRYSMLKGSGSLVCTPGPDERPHIEICTEGNPGMASGGMGDVLAGLVAGLLAQGLGLADSLRCAVAVHGESADLAAAETGPRGLLATDLLPHCQQLLNRSPS